jgi:septal ring factor EnvC (AmiA/AmiB activator)
MTRARRSLVQAASASLEAPASTVSPMKKVVTEDDRSDNIAKGLAAVSRDLQTIMVANKQHIQMLKDCNRLNRNMKKVVSQLEESSIDSGQSIGGI